MSNKTTYVRPTDAIRRINIYLERLYKADKNRADIKLTPKQYDDYCKAIYDKSHTGNPYYHGIEIKKMGEA